MNNVYQTLIRPLITEKSTHQSGKSTEEHGGAYSFAVALEASKAEIKDAVEKIYGVKVVAVRTLTRKGKSRRFRFRVGHTSPMKRAVVVLAPGNVIDLI